MTRPRSSRSNSSNPPKVSSETLTQATNIKLPYLHPKINIEDLDLNSADDISHARLHPEHIKKTIVHDNVNYHIYSNGKLGSGSFGEVVLAQNATNGEWIALKRIKKMKDELLKQEISNLNNLGELVFHVQHVKEGNYLGMKLHQGTEFYQVLKGIKERRFQTLSYTQKLLIAKRILKAVADLHNAKAGITNPALLGVIKKIIHRDLKPENMLLDSDLQIRLADFGLSAMIENKVEGLFDNLMVGTKEYMAPESLTSFIPVYHEKSEVHHPPLCTPLHRLLVDLSELMLFAAQLYICVAGPATGLLCSLRYLQKNV